MKIPYSQNYSPAAPVLPVSLAVPEETPQIGPQPALIDTGADGTFIPTTLLEQLDVPIVYATNIRSHVGDTLQRVSVYKVDILLDTTRLPDIEVVGDDWGNEIIIGRNLLNKLQLLLDGPKQTTELKT
jgi:predicted aspartyl protease